MRRPYPWPIPDYRVRLNVAKAQIELSFGAFRIAKSLGSSMAIHLAMRFERDADGWFRAEDVRAEWVRFGVLITVGEIPLPRKLPWSIRRRIEPWLEACMAREVECAA